MYTDEPEVTMFHETHQFYEDIGTEHAMYDWAIMLELKGEDGKTYWADFGCMAMQKFGTFAALPFSAVPTDFWHLTVRWEPGRVVPIPGTIYKLADFPQDYHNPYRTFPGGSLKVTKDEKNNKAMVDLPNFHLDIDVNNHTWHMVAHDEVENMGADLTHTPVGYPMWYGQDKMHVYADHMRSQGYFWPGLVEGTLTIEGKKVKVKGHGSRERFYCPDQSNVEAGAWCDLIFFYFDELHGVLCEQKLADDRDYSLYLIEEKQHFAPRSTRPALAPDPRDGSFEILHDDWAYFAPIGAFIPTTYYMKLEVEAGVLEMTAKAKGCKCLAQSGKKQADVPNLILNYDRIEGTFTYKDGRKKTLTNGVSACNIVLWKTYPTPFFDVGMLGETDDTQQRFAGPTLG